MVQWKHDLIVHTKCPLAPHAVNAKYAALSTIQICRVGTAVDGRYSAIMAWTQKGGLQARLEPGSERNPKAQSMGSM